MSESKHLAQKIGLLYLVAWCISPPLSYGTIYRIIAIVIVGLFIVTQLGRLQKKENGLFIFGVFFIAYSILLSAVTGESITIRLGMYIFISFLICAFYIQEEENVDDLQSVVTITLLLFVIWNITSLRGIQQYPNVMRALAKNLEGGEFYAKRGIGGYGYLYAVLLMIPVGIERIKKKNSFVNKLIDMAFLITTYLLIFQSGYFLAMVLSVVCVPIMIISSLQNKSSRIGLMVFLILLTLIILIFAESIISWLISISFIPSITRKLVDVYQLLNDDVTITGSEFATRYERYSRAFVYAISHPITGGLKYSVGGNHSHFLDFAAQYGFILLYGYIKIIKRPFERIRNDTTVVGNSVMFMALILLTMNTLAYSMAAVMFIVVPIHCRLTERTFEHG